MVVYSSSNFFTEALCRHGLPNVCIPKAPSLPPGRSWTWLETLPFLTTRQTVQVSRAGLDRIMHYYS